LHSITLRLTPDININQQQATDWAVCIQRAWNEHPSCVTAVDRFWKPFEWSLTSPAMASWLSLLTNNYAKRRQNKLFKLKWSRRRMHDSSFNASDQLRNLIINLQRCQTSLMPAIQTNVFSRKICDHNSTCLRSVSISDGKHSPHYCLH